VRKRETGKSKESNRTCVFPHFPFFLLLRLQFCKDFLHTTSSSSYYLLLGDLWLICEEKIFGSFLKEKREREEMAEEEPQPMTGINGKILLLLEIFNCQRLASPILLL